MSEFLFEVFTWVLAITLCGGAYTALFLLITWFFKGVK
jgi:hypothetical protein